MEIIYLHEIMEATVGVRDSRYSNIAIHSISTDSRRIQRGDLFIALEGDNFDGHDFVEDAVRSGAAAVVVSKPVKLQQEVPVIQVDNTLKALWQVSAYYRRKFSKPVIAVTGSVGKTSTKDMVAAVLSSKYCVHKSQGNYNNHIGLPMTIFGLENKHDLAVLEMGMSGFGEIRELSRIARPSVAMITNIGLSHIEKLGSRENILKAKLEILEGMDENGVLILNADDSFLQKVNGSFAGRVVRIGIDVDADFTGYAVVDKGEKGVTFKVKLQGREYDVHIPALGRHNVYNALFGIACGVELGLNPEEILEGIRNYQPEKMRLNIIEMDGIRFINDSYNASPDSMQVALQVLKGIAGENRTIAILGNILELGGLASIAHQNVGKMCGELGIDFVAIIGENAQDLGQGIGDESRYKIFHSHDEIIQFMKGFLRKNDVVLVKGSRGMKMEKIFELW
ncbi:MAG: UDP-N-acetylmuramoyl-tripeptide--D-alanyl-D-alanine ligase [Clostridia bacterium]|jgi:UDP-N-acetylmuramoyl-tripeptide--D-alanyl-D-alanine ligase